jgi:sialate O-acetylesterase
MKTFIPLWLLLTGVLSTSAAVTVDKMFSDHMVLQRDLAVPVWGTAHAGEKVTVTFRDQTKTATADADGKWMLRLDPMKVGAAGEMKVGDVVFKDVLVGEVWLGSGQSNMAGGVGGYMKKDPVLTKIVEGGPYPALRLYGKGNTGWQVATPQAAKGFSAIHFSFGYNLHKELKDVPVGLMVGAVGGTPSGRWLTEDMASADAALMKQFAVTGHDSFESYYASFAEKKKAHAEAVAAAKKAGKKAPRFRGGIKVGDLYEAHVEPKAPYGMRGVLWDQGEGRVQISGVDQYTAMNALITGWRNVWGQGDFPFLHVQKPSGGGVAWDPANPTNRGAVAFADKLPAGHLADPKAMHYQLMHIKMGTLKNAPLVTASDLGTGVHPACKSGYGQRASQVALGHVYGRDVAICGPVYKSHKVEGATMRVSFDHVGKGLAFKYADAVRGFEIAGADGNWQWAEAKIDGATIVLSHKDVPTPVHVQYAFQKRNNYANLFNKDGLPALMFTTVEATK